ncbi:MAG: metallophosphoesterase, partial [Alphaproteobacteria bacterium]|nr:metallophosphoesterase [Alphaproteobacteria bacterium]
MLFAVFIYELFIVFLSAFLAWHYPVSNAAGLVLWGAFFISFNGLAILIYFTHKTCCMAKPIVLVASFLLALVSYLTLLFIINDLLLIIPVYGSLFFKCRLCFVLMLTLIAGLVSFYAVWNSSSITTTKYQLHSSKNVSVRLAFLSDLHVAPTHMSMAKIADIFDILKNEKPDYVILGGDIIEMRPDYFMERTIIEAFRHFNTQNTMLAVVGNHEYYGGQIQDNVSAMEQAGIIVLKDAVRMAPEYNIAFIGRDDRTNPHRLPLHRLMKNISDSVYQIVIDHDPHSILETVSTSADLQISGHTHAGQIFP